MTIERRPVSLALALALLGGCALPEEPSGEPTGTSAAALTTAVAAAPPPPPADARLRVAVAGPKKARSCGECSIDYTACLLGCGGDWNCAEACAGRSKMESRRSSPSPTIVALASRPLSTA